jgi:hypothetical protein
MGKTFQVDLQAEIKVPVPANFAVLCNMTNIVKKYNTLILGFVLE